MFWGFFPDETIKEEKSKLLDDDNAEDKKGRKYVEGTTNEGSSLEEEGTSLQKQRGEIADEPKTARLLSFVQILTASFASFAHGSNDVR